MFNILTPGAAPAAPVADPKPAAQPEQSPASQKGAVSEQDALRGGDAAKMTQFTIADPSKPGAGPIPLGGSSVALGGLVQGKVAVDLIDALLPALLVVIAAKMKLDIKKAQVQLTAGEKATLAPLVDAYLNSISLNFDSPGIALSMSLLVIYGGKLIEVFGVGFLEKKADERPAKAPERPVMRAVPPHPVNPAPASTNTDSFTPEAAAGPVTWTEGDVKMWMKKKKWSRERVEVWLQLNWEKINKGGK